MEWELVDGMAAQKTRNNFCLGPEQRVGQPSTLREGWQSSMQRCCSSPRCGSVGNRRALLQHRKSAGYLHSWKGIHRSYGGSALGARRGLPQLCSLKPAVPFVKRRPPSGRTPAARLTESLSLQCRRQTTQEPRPKSLPQEVSHGSGAWRCASLNSLP